MKIKSFYTISILASMGWGLLSGCNKQLDSLAPHDVSFEDQEFSTPSGFTKTTIANYQSMTTSGNAGYDYNWFNLSEFRGDNVKPIDITSTSSLFAAQDVDAFNFTNSSSKDFGRSYFFWIASYKSLLGINTVLKHVSSTETDTTILQAKAETSSCGQSSILTWCASMEGLITNHPLPTSVCR